MERFHLSFLKPVLLVLLIPALEVTISKLLIYRQHIGLIHPVTEPGLDLALLGLFITGILFLILLAKRDDFVSLVFRKNILMINLIFWAVFLLTTFNLSQIMQSINREILSLIWYTLSIATLASSFFIFFKLKDLIEKLAVYRIEILFALIAIIMLMVYHPLNQHLWHPFSELTTAGSFTILKWLGVNVVPVPNPIYLAHPFFTAAIEDLCSGLEGMCFFVFIFSLILMFQWRSYSKIKMISIYLTGTAYMFLINIFRVVVFFIMAMPVSQKWGLSAGEQLFVWFYLPYVSWILYLITIGIFFTGLSFLSPKKERN